jgi:PKD repeat protein
LQGKSTTHVYKEGSYTVKIVAIGITGLKMETTQNLVVSFRAQNLDVVITNDLVISKK